MVANLRHVFECICRKFETVYQPSASEKQERSLLFFPCTGAFALHSEPSSNDARSSANAAHGWRPFTASHGAGANYFGGARNSCTALVSSARLLEHRCIMFFSPSCVAARPVAVETHSAKHLPHGLLAIQAERSLELPAPSVRY